MTDYDPRTDTGIPTEPVGSLPRPSTLQAAYADYDAGKISKEDLESEQEAAVKDSIERFEATGSPVITDGEQRKYHNFWTYCVDGLANTAPGGFRIPFAAGHVRQMPRGPRPSCVRRECPGRSGRPVPAPGWH